MKKKWVQMKGRFRKNLLIVLGLLVFFCVAGVVQATVFRFQEVEGSNGSVVRDNNTGLEWPRCLYGQSWTGSGCSGAAWQGTWYDAVNLTAPGGFRLPTLDELETLTPYNMSIFSVGDYGNYWFWSSTSYAQAADYAWALGFYKGFRYIATTYNSKGYNGYQVRLVRSGL